VVVLTNAITLHRQFRLLEPNAGAAELWQALDDTLLTHPLVHDVEWIYSDNDTLLTTQIQKQLSDRGIDTILRTKQPRERPR
jgi:hypothetical protein